MPPQHPRNSPPDSLKFAREREPLTEELLSKRGRDLLTRLQDKDPDNADRLQRAHDILRHAGPEYAASMHAVARSLRADCIHAFVSHRLGKDASAASALAEALRGLAEAGGSGQRLRVSLAVENPFRISGRPFREEIVNKIGAAHWFFLLTPDPSDNTDWCMFETGMFRGTMVSSEVNRLIPICHPQVDLPDPIDEFQAHKADNRDLFELFHGLFREPNPLPGWDPLCPALEDDEISAHAAKVAEAFLPPSSPIRLTPWVQLTVLKANPLADPSDLAGASIQTNEKTAAYFGLEVAPNTWGELVELVESRNPSQWLTELTAVLAKARMNRSIRAVSGAFESDIGGKVLRPVVQSVDDFGTETTFLVVFVDEISSAPVHRVEAGTLALITAVRMNQRIRWEVVERFRGVTWDEEHIRDCNNVLSRIEREVDSVGRWDVDLLCGNFDDEEDRIEVRDIVKQWRELRSAGTSAEDYMTGTLDTAFDRFDSDRVTELFPDVIDLNVRFLRVANPVLESLVEAGDTRTQRA